jgi:hypothetical protein
VAELRRAEGYSALTDEKLAEMREILAEMQRGLQIWPTLDATNPE